MVHARILALPLIAALALPAAAESHGHFRARDLAPEFDGIDLPQSQILPLKQALRLVDKRFKGRLIAARLVPPTPYEREHGVVLVHQMRLLTRARDVLVIRLDAQTGAFLEVAGAGLTEARRKGNDE